MEDEKTCSGCTHAARKNEYVNTIPSIVICLNEKADNYLEARAWSCSCELWEVKPEDVFANLEYF